MFELDKQQFGAFVAGQRRQKQMTQKDLAQKLTISDKAVSKWERGLNMPDITLLVPLAQALDVSVTELLECRRIPQTEPMSANHVEILVKKAITMTEEDPQSKSQHGRKHGLLYLTCLAVMAGEIALLAFYQWLPQPLADNLLLMELLSVIFGGYFCLFARQKLPSYYDENKISTYSDGIFRMNLVGIHFNNQNWPHIIKVGRNWALASIVLMPILYSILSLVSQENLQLMNVVLILLHLSVLIIPLYYVGKKYK